jgi:lipid A 4'-phosphatase
MQPDRPPLIPGRAAVFLIVTLALGPGLVANIVLKEHWGRPRPIDVMQFGGAEHFVAWWNPYGDCAKNCSFVSGDVAGAMWTIAPAALTPLPWRPLAYAGAIGLTVVVALLRMAFGGHFVTDVFFAGFFTFLITWGVYALIYRWPASPLTEERINAMLERLAAPGKAMRARWREQIVQAMRNRDANEQG